MVVKLFQTETWKTLIFEDRVRSALVKYSSLPGIKDVGLD